MCKSLGIITTAAIGIAALSLDRSGACWQWLCCWGGLLGFGIGAIVGSAAHAAGGICGSAAACLLCAATAASLLRGRGLWSSISLWV